MVEICAAEARSASEIAAVDLRSGEFAVDRSDGAISMPGSGFCRIGLEPGKTARIGKCNGTIEVYYYTPSPRGAIDRIRAAWRALFG